MKNQTTILSTAFLAPVQYYCKLISYQDIQIEAHENYSKQSFRNRCVIYSSNGTLTLSIPIQRSNTPKILIRDIQISYDANWQKLHWKAIESAYNNSPFYLYYIDRLEPFYSQKHKFLLDFNLQIQQIILSYLKISPNILLTQDYLSEYDLNIADFRDSIHPKPRMQKSDNDFDPIKYNQIFDEKFGFIENLSIIDLLFNMGPDSFQVLKNSITK